MWGISRQRSLHNKEEKIREIRRQEKPAKDAAAAAEKQRRYRGIIALVDYTSLGEGTEWVR